jgi:hypothetical protein
VIYVGIDDTDMPDTPGTNHLARHLVATLSDKWHGHLITRHQLLDDPRVPCTRKNGCVAIAFRSTVATPTGRLADRISAIMQSWCPSGSDPGLCIAENTIPHEVVEFGRECQRQLVSQRQARELAQTHGILMRGLGGTEDGVIGALAAVGLMNTRNDGRVIFVGGAQVDHFYVSGVHAINAMPTFGVDEVRRLDNGQPVVAGSVDLGKRLRPNYREGKIVLFVSPCQHEGCDWLAERVL